MSDEAKCQSNKNTEQADSTGFEKDSAVTMVGNDTEAGLPAQNGKENQGSSMATRHGSGFLPFLVFISVDADATKSSNRTKWLLTWIVSLGALATPLSSGILFPVLSNIAEDLHTSVTVVNLSIAFSSLIVAITPLWWSYLAESYGRRVVYLLSFFLLTVFNVLSAVSVNVGMLIAMRLLANAACASLQSVSAGTISDLWEPRERGKAMGVFFLGPMVGPMLAPIIGGALAIRWNWRSTQWFIVIYGFVLLVLLTFFMPETSPNLQKPGKKKDENTRTNSKVVRFFIILVKPMESIKLLRFLPILITVYYTSITFATYYLLYISIQNVFSKPPHSWNTLIIGLCYIPSALGYMVGAILGGRWTDYIMKRAARQAGRFDEEGKLILRPEDRISENALVAGILYPTAMLWWGWTAQKHVFWIVPLIANFFYGVGAMLITNVTMTMLTEFVPKKSTTGVAVTNLVRNTLACVAAVIAEPLINAIGNGWLFTAACLLCLISGLSLVLMRKNREKWSEKMRSAISQMD